MKKTELQTMVVNELKALAKKMKVKTPSSARKSDIVELLWAAFRKNNKPSASLNGKNGKSKEEPVRKSVAKNGVTRKKTVAAKPENEKKTIVPKPTIEVPGMSREWKMPPATEEPVMAQERVADAKYYTGPEQEKPEETAYGQLPLGYGEEKIALMVRDPYLAYAYWEVTPSRLQREKAWFGWNSKLAVRIYDVTGVQFDGRNAVGYYDQEVTDLIGSWYFDLGRPTHSFISDVGLLSPDGRFLTLARSNYVMMPRDGISDVVDEEWMLVDEEFWKLYGFPGGPSSPHLQEMIRIRRMQQVTSPGTFSRERSKRK
jgi:hypothetical protein